MTVDEIKQRVENGIALIERYRPATSNSAHYREIRTMNMDARIAVARGDKKILGEAVDAVVGHCCDDALCTQYNRVDALILLSVLTPWEVGAYKTAADADYKAMLQAVKSIGNYRMVMGLQKE